MACRSKLMMLGHPSSGKTTILESITSKWQNVPDCPRRQKKERPQAEQVQTSEQFLLDIQFEPSDVQQYNQDEEVTVRKEGFKIESFVLFNNSPPSAAKAGRKSRQSAPVDPETTFVTVFDWCNLPEKTYVCSFASFLLTTRS